MEYRKSYEWVRTTVFRRPARVNHASSLEKGQLPSFAMTGSMDSAALPYAKNDLTLSSSVSTVGLARPVAAMTAAEKWDAGLDLDFDEGPSDEEDDLDSDSLSSRRARRARRANAPRHAQQARGGAVESEESRQAALSIKEFLDEKRSFSSELSASSNSRSAPSPTQTYPSPPRLSTLVPEISSATPTMPPRSHSRNASGAIRVTLSPRPASFSDDELSPRTPAVSS